MQTTAGWQTIGLVTWFLSGFALAGPDRAAVRAEVEADWQKQAEAWMVNPPGSGGLTGPVATTADAAGAVDGVKDGKYGFHTGGDPNPWWQVDLGAPLAIARIVVYNRLDYAPGLHNADNLVILTSGDAKSWLTRYENRGKHFGGISGAKPLEVAFQPGQLRARFVRLQVPSKTPILYHLDEVEIYGQADPAKNIALGRPADQSSVSIWSTSKGYIDPKRPFAYRTKDVIERGRRLAADLQTRGADTRPHLSELEAIDARLEHETDSTPAETRRATYLQARWAVRRLAFSNPLVRFDRLLFVKRFTQQCYPDICLNHMPWVSRPGGDLCVLEKPFAFDGQGQGLRNLLAGALGPGHVHGMDLRWDANRVVFGYARSKTGQPPFAWPPGHCVERYLAHKLRETEEPTHIYEIGIDGRGLRQLTRHDYWSDLDPTYLPNGDIAFVSERCGYSLQCNHDPRLDETSCNLYVMRSDGTNLRRLSANKDGDYLPHCLDDGTIGYTRWEYQERGLTQIQSLWTVRPDGTWADAIFKQHLNDPWALEDVRSIPGTANNKLVAIAAGHHTLAAGPVVVITPSVGLNDSRAIRSVTPWVLPPEGGMSGTAVSEGGVSDDGGYYMTPWALSEKYFLVSYSPLKTQPQGFPDYCRGTDEKGYALYLIDVFGNKELIYRDPEISSFIPIPLRPRPRPPILPDQTDPAQKYARCVLSDVGYGVPGVPRQRIRYLRIAQGVPWPYDRKHGAHRYEQVALSMGLGWTPVRILGTVPIEADGSAHFQVPVDEPVYFQLLDENQMELRRMRSFISFQPGEVRGCVGCHESRPVAPTAAPAPLAAQREPSIPVPPPWGDRPLSFLRDVQPVFDRHCVRCHGGLEPAAGLDFSGGLVGDTKVRTPGGGELGLDGHNRAYRTLISQQLVSYANKYDPAEAVTQPLAFGSHQSKLVRAIREGPCAKRASLTSEDWLRLVTWIDANAPYHDAFINMRPEKPHYDLPADRELMGKIAAVHTRRCGPCHKADEVSRPDWFDLHEPKKSLFLEAPLARESGGKGKCKQPVYREQSDRDYQEVRGLVENAVKKAWQFPRRDLRAIAGRDKGERTAGR